MKLKTKTPKFRCARLGTSLVTTALAAISLSAASAADWTGIISTDWNTAGNWSGGSVPTGQNAVINNGNSNNIATISADISVTPNDIVVQNGSRLDQTAGTAGTSGGAWMFVGQDNSAGTYNLANTGAAGSGITGFAQGSGSLNATGNLNVGAAGDNRTGTVRVNTSGTLAVSNELLIGDSLNSTGNFSLESGTMTVNNKITVGNNRGTGTVTMSGGTFTVSGTADNVIGRDKGTGVVTQSGGVVEFNHNAYIANGNNQSDPTSGTYNLSAGVLNVKREFVIGREGANATGTLNMTGGTITKTGDEKFLVGHNNAKGFVVQSGGTISANNELYIGNENSGAQGTYTLSGTGALTVSNEVVVGRESGTGILNVNGGVLKAKRDEANLIENLDTANVQSNGLKIDSNGFNVATSQALTGTGGLEKLGAGSLTLNGAQTYTGPTLVSAGTLTLALNSSITSAVTVAGGAALGGTGTIAGSLAFSSNAKFVFGLTTLLVNGSSDSVTFTDFGIDDLVGLTSATDEGTYTIIGGSATINTNGLLNLGSASAYSLGGGKSAYFSAGSLQVTVVPEPSTYALLVLAGLGLAGHVIRWRR